MLNLRTQIEISRPHTFKGRSARMSPDEAIRSAAASTTASSARLDILEANLPNDHALKPLKGLSVAHQSVEILPKLIAHQQLRGQKFDYLDEELKSATAAAKVEQIENPGKRRKIDAQDDEDSAMYDAYDDETPRVCISQSTLQSQSLTHF